MGKKGTKSRKPGLLASISLWTLRSTVAVLTVLVCLLLLLSGFSDLISPNTWVIPSFLGIAFGVLMLVGGLWSLTLLLTRRWRCLLAMVVTFVIIIVPARRYLPLHVSDNQPLTTSASGTEIDHIQRIRLLTYNTNLMGHAKLNDHKQPIPVLDVVKQSQADIVCMQEYSFSSARNGYSLDRLRQLTAGLYPHYDFTPYSYNRRSGLVILSKYPILKIDRIDHQKTDYIAAMYYQLDVDGQPLGIVNMHLQSNKLSKEDRQLYSDMIGHFEADSLSRIRSGMMHSLSVAWRHRANEVDKIKAYIHDHHPADMPLLICGDMNDTPVSYSSHTLRSLDLTDTWQETGLGLGITYSAHRFWFRIDHIFHSSRLRALRSNVRRDIGYSDHYPLEATFQLLPE